MVIEFTKKIAVLDHHQLPFDVFRGRRHDTPTNIRVNFVLPDCVSRV